MNRQQYGNYFGYPECCVKSFIEKEKKSKSQLIIKKMGTGFVPCNKHAIDIINKKIKISELICNRKCEKPFPIG